MDKFEYTFLIPSSDKKVLVKELNELGQKNWEVVGCITPTGHGGRSEYILLKRKYIPGISVSADSVP